MTDPDAAIESLRSRAQRLETPCGDGHMVWRRWGSGPPVVLLHGGYGSWMHWVRNIDPLARDHTVYAPDLPGMGESALPDEPFDGWSVATIVADGLDELIPAPTPIDLVGFSFGGVIGGPITRLRADRVRSLTIVGAGGHGPDRRPIELLGSRHLDDPDQRRDIHRANLARLMFADPANIDPMAVQIQVSNVDHGRLATRRISRTTILDDTLRDIPVPVTAIFGQLDATSYPSLEDRLGRLRSTVPGITIEIVPGAGHWVQYEAAAAFDAVLLDLLARVGQPSPPVPST